MVVGGFAWCAEQEEDTHCMRDEVVRELNRVEQGMEGIPGSRLAGSGARGNGESG